MPPKITQTHKITKIRNSELIALTNKLEPQLKRAFITAIADIRKNVSLAELTAAVESGNPRAIEAILMRNFAGSLTTTTLILQQALTQGGAIAAKKVVSATKNAMVFDGRNPQVQSFIQRYQFDLVRDLDTMTREGIRSVIANADLYGVAPRTQARTLRNVVGLTRLQAESVNRLARAAQENGMSAAKIAKLVDKQTAAKIKARAINIARTETTRALNSGQQEAWRQAVDQDLIPATTKREWIITPDDRLCIICSSLDGKLVGLEENFNTTVKFSATREQDFTTLTPPIHPGCYADDVKVYTRKGFEFFKDVKIGDECLSLQPDTLQLEWQPVVATQKYNYDGELVHYYADNNSICLSVTPDHSQFVRRRVDRGNKGRVFESQFIKGYKAFTSPENRLYISSEHHEDTPALIMGYPAIPFCEFMGWYLSEGSTTERERDNGYYYQTKITQYKYQVELEETFAAVGIKYNKGINGDYNIPYDGTATLNKWLFKFGKSYEKFIPDEIMSAGTKGLEAFLKTYILGDGYVKVSNCFGTTAVAPTINTSSVRMRDQLIEVCLRLGKAASFKLVTPKGTVQKHHNGVYTTNNDCWNVNILTSKTRMPKVTTRPYKGKVYDVSLARNHTLLVEQDGRICWSGNCRCSMGLKFD